LFALHWELALIVGGVISYINGKTWNDTVGVMAITFKTSYPFGYAVITTAIGITFVLAETSGL
jgi:hypothetical protein